MKTHIIIKSVVLLVICFTSCNDEGAFWGKTNYYENFLFVKYKPVVMEQTLVFDFNEDAQRLIKSDIYFEIVKKNANGEFVVAKNIILYKNDKECKDNILSINKNDKEVKIGIEFTEKASYGPYTFFMREKGTSGIERIDYQEIGSGIYVVKNKDMNPLLKGLMWIAIIVLVTCFAWIVFLKPILFESFKVQRLIITTDHFKSIKIKGCKQVICTNKKQKQTFINKLFTGKIVFVLDEFFTIDLMITPRDKKTVRVKTPHGFETTSNLLSIGETLAMKNAFVTPSTTATLQIN